MPRETKEQRLAREEQARVAEEAARQEFLKTVPKRLVDAQVLAHSLGVSTSITLTDIGPSVHFFSEDDFSIDSTHGYDTEEWELEYLENQLAKKKEERDAILRRRTIAEDAWRNKLNDEEKSAIKEHIGYLVFLK